LADSAPVIEALGYGIPEVCNRFAIATFKCRDKRVMEHPQAFTGVLRKLPELHCCRSKSSHIPLILTEQQLRIETWTTRHGNWSKMPYFNVNVIDNAWE
jgi:hypothetical protein